MAKQAVLLLAHGTPETIEQIPEYLRNVVSGRPLPQTVVEEIQHRYAQIGHSPLTEITLAQARLVEAELAAAGQSIPVYVGMRNWRPYIPEVVRQMRADGIEQAAVICMAPQNSRTSVGLYRRAVEAEAGDLRIDFTPGWAQHPLLADAFAERLRPALAKLTKEVGGPVPVLFTAHSVPTRTVEAPAADADAGKRLWPGQGVDPYAEEARHTAELVAARVPEILRWWFAFQSQGASGGPWLGPSVEETLDQIAAEGVKALLLQPIGFLCDHVEILFDVDILFRAYASKLGVQLERPESLNASVTLAKAVADLARGGLGRLGTPK
ncbi:MAG: ferrochelatase [Terracidiphilus sp.]|nr:ferrochelatase [Terracidiphilus sp.]MDR3796565.1 ferrochelatase [Terracidiphilus sp.]